MFVLSESRGAKTERGWRWGRHKGSWIWPIVSFPFFSPGRQITWDSLQLAVSPKSLNTIHPATHLSCSPFTPYSCSILTLPLSINLCTVAANIPEVSARSRITANSLWIIWYKPELCGGTNKRACFSPAIGGPAVMGRDIRPRRYPMACEACMGPTNSNAMGAIMVRKQPSHSPKNTHTTTSPSNTEHWGISMDIRPRAMKDTTWNTQWRHN